jgi:antitoxin VapB
MSQLETLAAIGDRRGLDSLLIREPASIAWLLGCRYHVPNTLDAACFDVIVSGLRDGSPSLSVVSNAIEAPRLTETEFTAEGPPIAEHYVVSWWGDRSQHFPTGPGVGADRPWAGAEANVAGDLAAARRVLNAHQCQQLAELSATAGAVVGRVARRLTPGLSEYEVAGRLSAELLAAELEPVVLMVAADGRDRRHRHPLPTAVRGESSFLLVCCARRHGLIASVTRAVLFSGAGHDKVERAERYMALLRVEQTYLDASRPGARLGDIVSAGMAAYAVQGFDANEWTRHHQGGLSGWMPREFPAHAGSDDVLTEGHVVAWNPSGDGVKVEDTTLVTAEGVRPLVTDPEWPVVKVGGRRRPGLLWL